MLILILGPVCSGKSDELMRIGDRYEFAAKKKVLYVTPKIMGNKITSRNGCGKNAINDLPDIFNEYDVICFDEAQFFESKEFVYYIDILAYKKIVILSALSGDFRRENMGYISHLMPKADQIIHLTSICYYCQHDAAFSMKISGDKHKTIDIGQEKYIPVCREHHIERKLI